MRDWPACNKKKVMIWAKWRYSSSRHERREVVILPDLLLI